MRLEMSVSKVFVFRKQIEPCIPLYTSLVPAGFPSPADDYLENPIDLNSYVSKNPSATYFVRVDGDSMINSGIFDGDLVAVDRAVEAKSGHVVIAAVNGELTIKRLIKQNETWYLSPNNPSYKPIEISEELDCVIWGVVTYVIHSLLP